MCHYLTSLICLNGHVFRDNIEGITRNAKMKKQYCKKCGEELIYLCPNCGEPIRGDYDVGIPIIGAKITPAPNYCFNCGKPFPWTEKFLSNAAELISLDSQLTDDEKSTIKLAIKDMIVDSPSTKVSVAKYKIIIKNATETVRESLHNIIVDVISETAKKMFSDS